MSLDSIIRLQHIVHGSQCKLTCFLGNNLLLLSSALLQNKEKKQGRKARITLNNLQSSSLNLLGLFRTQVATMLLAFALKDNSSRDRIP